MSATIVMKATFHNLAVIHLSAFIILPCMEAVSWLPREDRMHFATITGIANHCDVRLIDAGGEMDAPVFVFINSFGTDFQMRKHVRSKLSDKLATLLHDKRGHGLSVGHERDHSV
ncbi:hypothetical protein [Rhizobium sp. NFR07]|uniref:hypothetical protein n=1 Tax=Rhizobium sp. NFR07 TaxID=1566262 RepID=UPI001160D180|nr:hypothetical protein [Rhizobium sp. NFR07]